MRKQVLLSRSDDNEKLKLLKAFEPLMKKCFRMYVKDYNYYEDAMQEGYFTILKCIDNYDLNSKNDFPSYAKMAVIHNLKNFSKKLKHDLRLDDQINEEGGTLLDTLKSCTNIEEETIHEYTISTLYNSLNALTDKQREIIESYYFKNLTLQQISKNKRCHYMSISKLKDRALKTLRKELQRYVD